MEHWLLLILCADMLKIPDWLWASALMPDSIQYNVIITHKKQSYWFAQMKKISKVNFYWAAQIKETVIFGPLTKLWSMCFPGPSSLYGLSLFNVTKSVDLLSPGHFCFFNFGDSLCSPACLVVELPVWGSYLCELRHYLSQWSGLLLTCRPRLKQDTKLDSLAALKTNTQTANAL